jgi:hypothetical protein
LLGFASQKKNGAKTLYWLWILKCPTSKVRRQEPQWMSPSIMAVVLLSTDEKFNDLLNAASQFPEKST